MTRRGFIASSSLAAVGSLTSAPVRSLIGGRIVEETPSGPPTASSYVKDGLIGMWDGIENAGLGVHDESAQTWTDLTGLTGDAIKIGSPSWTINAGATSGNNNIFRVAFNNSSPLISAIKGGEWTLELCFSHDYDSFASRCPFSIEDSSGTSSTYRIVQVFQNAQEGYKVAWMNKTSTNLLSSVSDAVGSKFGTYTVSVSTSNVNLIYSPYWNGTEGIRGTQNTSYSYIFPPSTIDSVGVDTWYMRIGRTHNNYMTARFHSIRMYNHALKASEVQKNSMIDKIRFEDNA